MEGVAGLPVLRESSPRLYLMTLSDPLSHPPPLPHSIVHRGVQELKQGENISRSPWFSHITSSIQGLGVIHAYDKKDDCISK